MNLLDRIKSWFGPEAGYRGPATGYSQWGNAFEIPIGDGFQSGLSLSPTARGGEAIPAVYACVMAIAKAISMCYPQHIVPTESGRFDRSKTSPASRVLRKPNAYQTWPQFILNAIAFMLLDGESFILLLRDDRFAVTSMHLMPRNSCSPYVNPEDGSIFYSVGQNPVLPMGMDFIVPARDVMHLRQYCPRHPLIGETALTAAALAMGTNVALSANQTAFYSQMSRPSGILSTDAALTKDQMKMLRDAFNEQAAGMNSGKIPILGNGLKFNQIAITSQDAQLVQAQRMSIEEISRVFGVPLPVIGDLSHATMANVESVINFWLATGLGSILENVERSFDAAFGLTGDEYIELDVTALLRMDFASRVEGYTKAIQGGLLAPNEARNKERLPPMEGGDELYMQRQMTSLDILSDLNSAELDAKVNPPAPTAPAAPATPAEPATTPAEGKALVIELFNRKRA